MSSEQTGKAPRCFVDLLDQVICSHGFTVREAKKIRKAIFKFWRRELWIGTVVETPLGWLQAVRSPRPRYRWNKMRGQHEHAYKYERRIVFTRRKDLIEVIPTTFYSTEETQLLKKLGRKPWATTAEEAAANAKAIEEALLAAVIPAGKPREQMSHYEILAKAQPQLFRGNNTSMYNPPRRPNRWTGK